METNIDVVYSGNKNLIKGFSCLRMKAFTIFVPCSTPFTWLALCLFDFVGGVIAPYSGETFISCPVILINNNI